MHLAAEGAPVVMTAGSDTPPTMNARPADLSPPKLGSRGRPGGALGLAMRGRGVSEVDSAGHYALDAGACSRSAHWGSELGESHVLVAKAKQDCSDSSSPSEHGHDRGRETAP
jgi:hypothetical protein